MKYIHIVAIRVYIASSPNNSPLHDPGLQDRFVNELYIYV